MGVGGGHDYPSWKYVSNCTDTKDAEKLCMEERKSLVTRDHTILQMKIVAITKQRKFHLKCQVVYMDKKFKSVQTCARGDNNKIVKIH